MERKISEIKEFLSKSICRIKILDKEKRALGVCTGWMINGNTIITCGHIFADNKTHNIEQILAIFVDEEQELVLKKYIYNKDECQDYAILDFANNMTRSIWLNCSVNNNSFDGNVLSYGYDGRTKLCVPAEGKILGKVQEESGSNNYLLSISSKEMGVDGFSGAPIFSIDEDAVIAMQVESNGNDIGAGRDRIFAYPLASMKSDLSNLLIRTLSVNDVNKISDCSLKYIKSSSWTILFGEEKIASAGADVLKSFDISDQRERIKTISCLFAACCKGRKYNNIYNDRDYEKIDIGYDTIFEWVRSIITESSNEDTSEFNAVVNFRGECSVGKTTLLGVVYIYLLRSLQLGEFEYIPYYFNLEYVIKHVDIKKNDIDIIDDIYEKCHKELGLFLNKSKQISDELGLPRCIIIDGLDRYSFLSKRYSLSIEDYLSNYMDSIKGDNDRYIFSVNGYKFWQQNEREDQLKSKYVVFLNEVNVVTQGHKSKRFYDMVEAYSKLNGVSNKNEIERIVKKIIKYRRVSISLNFLYNNFKILKQVAEDEEPWKVLCNYNRQLESEAKRNFESYNEEEVSRVAYLLQYEKKTFEDYLISKKSWEEYHISYNEYCIIKSKPDLRKYLIAVYYGNELRHLLKPDTRIEVGSILNRFLPRDICVLCRVYLSQREDFFTELVEKRASEFSDQALSMLLYLAGHTKSGNAEKLLTVIEGKCTVNTISLRRSKCLAHAGLRDNSDEYERYLNSLIWNAEERLFNRVYQMTYYEDKFDPQIIENKNIVNRDDIGLGNDFYNCYRMLFSKISYATENDEPYPLIKFDLFTITDLIYSRLCVVFTKDRKNKKVRTFFYDKRYNEDESCPAENLLDEVVELLERTLSGKAIDISHTDRRTTLYVYFTYMLAQFKRALSKIRENKGIDVELPYISETDGIKKIFSIVGLNRIGWDIKNELSVSDNVRTRLNCKKDDVVETYGNHILETLYIAIFYLPEQYNQCNDVDGLYDKNIIMRLILTRELGRTSTTDYTPYAEKFGEVVDLDDFARREILLLFGINGGIDFHDIYDINTKEQKIANRNINIVIADELLNIQMEYKYYQLLLEDSQLFSKERRGQFQEYFDKVISTSVSEDIRKKLIFNNPSFYDVIQLEGLRN